MWLKLGMICSLLLAIYCYQQYGSAMDSAMEEVERFESLKSLALDK